MANMTALSINESLFYIPFDHAGVISVCNNKYGNELACIVSDISDDRISLNIGDSVCIKRIVSEGTESVHEFVMPDFSNQKKEFMSDKGIYGMEVCTYDMYAIYRWGSSHFCCNHKSRSSIC